MILSLSIVSSGVCILYVVYLIPVGSLSPLKVTKTIGYSNIRRSVFASSELRLISFFVCFI